MSTNGNGNALIVFQHQGMVVTKEEKETLVGAISTQNPTDAELKLYFYDCARRGVHPLDKLIHFTKRQGRYTPVVSIEYMRMRAESSGCYAGSDEPEFEEAEGSPYPTSARVTVYKMVDGMRCPFAGKVLWKEIAPDVSTGAGFMWKKMPYHMLAKCAGRSPASCTACMRRPRWTRPVPWTATGRCRPRTCCWQASAGWWASSRASIPRKRSAQL